jgi:hypothetical protein
VSAQFLRYTLIGDGSSDRALMPILDWLLTQTAEVPFRGLWAEHPVQGGLTIRVRKALELYPCDLLFIHRDAENERYEERLGEIRAAVAQIEGKWVSVIPVRMTEAWLLTSEAAIRAASGNPNGGVPLVMPEIKRIEDSPDPKHLLFDLLKRASGLNARRQERFDVHRARNRVSERMDDFTALRRLGAFQRLETALREAFS